jgi:hypothetical protein
MRIRRKVYVLKGANEIHNSRLQLGTNVCLRLGSMSRFYHITGHEQSLHTNCCSSLGAARSVTYSQAEGTHLCPVVNVSCEFHSPLSEHIPYTLDVNVYYVSTSW